MEKLSSFFIGVIDFFAALVPGAATVGVLLALMPGLQQQLVATELEPEAAILAFVVAAYILGQGMNSIGSYVLDVVYDVFYAPDRGLLVCESNASGWGRVLSAIHGWKFPFGAFVSGLVEKDTKQRAARLKAELDKLAGESPAPGVYARVRAYCMLAMPAAFAEIERLESEQKFFRTTTIATFLIAGVMRGQGHATSWWIWLLGAFLFTRYIAKRRKTIERAYLLFGLRWVAPLPASAAA